MSTQRWLVKNPFVACKFKKRYYGSGRITKENKTALVAGGTIYYSHARGG